VSVTLPASLSRPYPRRQDFRERSNYLLAASSEIARTPLRWSCRAWSCQQPKPPREWRNAVILGPSHIGDVMYNTPSLPLLRACLPQCKWTYVVSGPSAQVLEGNPNLDEVISIDESGGLAARLRRGRARLAGHRFDAAIAYAVGSSWKDLSLAALLGIPNRAGYVHKGFSGLVTHPLSIRFPQPFPGYFRDMVCQLTGQPTEAIPSLRPLVYLQPRHEKAADEICARLGLDCARQSVLACAVTSRQPSGMWPQEQFLETIRLVRAQQSCAVILMGAKSDAEALQGLAGQLGPGTFVVAGDLDLLSMIALLRRCTAALTPDSGSRHLANAAHLPVVFLRNLFSRQVETGAYCDTDHDMVPTGVEMISPENQPAVFAQISPAKAAACLCGLLAAA
jgi:ADP-heptose:LPS heptosyltransferase